VPLQAVAPPADLLTEHSPVASLLLSKAGVISYATAAAGALLGARPPELIGQNLFSLAHADDRGRLVDAVRGAATDRDHVVELDIRFMAPTGVVHRLAGRVVSVSHTAGAVISHWWDRAHPLAQPAFGLLDEQVRVLFENALHVTMIVDPNGGIRLVSPAIERMLGYSPDRVVGSGLTDLLHAEDAVAVMKLLEQRTRHTHAGSGRFVEFRALHSDGSWRVLEAIITDRLDNPLIGGIVIDARDVTERKWSAERLQRSLDTLLAIHDVGRLLGSRLEQQEIGAALLAGATRIAPAQAAALLLRGSRDGLRVARTVGQTALWHALRRGRAARLARQQAMSRATPVFFSPANPRDGVDHVEGWAIPLRVHDRAVGVLEVYGRAPADAWPLEELGILADQAASALERARLYDALAEREHRLEQLVRQLLQSQEEERRRVAYEVHDGLAQLAAAAQQHLEAFACGYRSRNPERAEELRVALALACRTVEEARRTIAGLRPTVLDDFGLAPAISFELQNLRADGWQVDYTDELGPTRLEAALETALFRVFQEAVANTRKHSHSRHVAVALQRRGRHLRLQVRDWGQGFQPAAVRGRHGPSERVGLAGMQERIGLLHGRCIIQSRPGAGTRITVDVPLVDPSGQSFP
jgi:PAS domain S-box-containing protein